MHGTCTVNPEYFVCVVFQKFEFDKLCMNNIIVWANGLGEKGGMRKHHRHVVSGSLVSLYKLVLCEMMITETPQGAKRNVPRFQNHLPV